MSDTGTKATLTAPTADELKKGPLVTLIRPGWNGYTWSFVGFAYPIRFVEGKATVLEDHFDEWLGEGLMASYGVSVERPKPAKKTTAAEKVAAKTPAVKKPTTKKRSSK